VKKERLYDTLTDEEIDIFGFFADKAVKLLSLHMMQWKQHFGFRSSKRNIQSTRVVAWTKYRKTMEATRIPTSKITGFRPPQNPEQTERGRAITQIYDKIFPVYLQGDEYIDACRKTSSIMSMRTWAERRRKKETRDARPLPIPISHKPSLTLAEKREKWRESIDSRPANIQSEIGLRDTNVCVTETPITVLPPQKTEFLPREVSHEVNLIMPTIMSEAESEQEIHDYPKPKWFKRLGRRKRQTQD